MSSLREQVIRHIREGNLTAAGAIVGFELSKPVIEGADNLKGLRSDLIKLNADGALFSHGYVSALLDVISAHESVHIVGDLSNVFGDDLF